MQADAAYLQHFAEVEGFDVLVQAAGHAWVHCGAAAQHNVLVQGHTVVHIHVLQIVPAECCQVLQGAWLGWSLTSPGSRDWGAEESLRSFATLRHHFPEAPLACYSSNLLVKQ